VNFYAITLKNFVILLTTGHFYYYVVARCHSRATGASLGRMFLGEDATWRAGIS